MIYYQKPKYWEVVEDTLHYCNHPLYSQCTLFRIGNRGLAVIQQRFDKHSKSTYWGPIDPWIAYDLVMNGGFHEYLDRAAQEPENGLYFTIPVRVVMRALGMRPMKKEFWETRF